MGLDPALFFLANLFFYYHENKWISEFKKTDIGKSRHLVTFQIP